MRTSIYVDHRVMASVDLPYVQEGIEIMVPDETRRAPGMEPENVWVRVNQVRIRILWREHEEPLSIQELLCSKTTADDTATVLLSKTRE